MKKILTFVLLGWMSANLYSQHFNHTLGVVYNQFLGTYGNMDAMGIQYNPQFQRTKGNLTCGLSFPMSYNAVVSSARESKKGMVELPAMLEMSFTPCGLCSSYQAMSIFAGAGISKIFTLHQTLPVGNFINASVGVRMPVTKKSMELRLNYSRNTVFTNLTRLGISLAYTL